VQHDVRDDFGDEQAGEFGLVPGQAPALEYSLCVPTGLGDVLTTTMAMSSSMSPGTALSAARAMVSAGEPATFCTAAHSNCRASASV